MRAKSQGKREALRRQLLFEFQLTALEERYEARLEAASRKVIDRYLQRVLVADSLAAVFED